MSCEFAGKQYEPKLASIDKMVNHVDSLKRIVYLYLDDVQNLEERQLAIKRLKRYCKMKDLSGLNNLFLNAHSEEVKKLYLEFQDLDGCERMHLLNEFDIAVNSSAAVYDEED